MASSTMKTKGNKQKKFLRRMATPLRALNRFYTKTIFGCAASFEHNTTMVNYAGMAPQVSASLPRNFSTNSSASSRGSSDHEEEELRELIRAVSTKLNGTSTKVEIKQVELRKPTSMVVPAAAELRSYSVGVGKIGRIDEDQPCDFKEVGDANSRVYPRCRSYAVNRRTTMF